MRRIRKYRLHVAALLCAAAALSGSRGADSGRDDPAIPAGILPGSDDARIAEQIQKYWTRMEEHPDDSSLHVNLGNLYALWGWDSEALVEYRKALALEPGSSVAWTNLGALYSAMGRESKAIRAFQKAIRANPNDGLAYYNLGALYERRGRFERSIDLFKRAIDLNPALASIRTNPQALYNPTLEIVLLQKYREQAGRLSLPLHWIPEPEPGASPKP